MSGRDEEAAAAPRGVRRRVGGRDVAVPPPAATPVPTRADTFDLHGHTFTKGDQIVVKPSAPRHRDGFTARVIAARLDADGNVDTVDVFGAPGRKAPLIRTLRPERLAPVPTRRRRRPTTEEEGS